jgi:hypothetical protein
MPKRTKEVPPPAVTRPVFAEPHEDSPSVVSGDAAEPAMPALPAAGQITAALRCVVDGWPVKSGERCGTCGTVAK